MLTGSARIRSGKVGNDRTDFASTWISNMPKRGFLEKAMPGLAVLFHYDRSQWKSDALAALVVAVVLIPSAIAYADLAKCAPAAGLYASIAGMVAYGLFTATRHVIVGPDAAIALLVGTAI